MAQDQVWFLGHMDRVNRALQSVHDLEDVLRAVLTVVLDALECDRAWLLHPCDPAATTWRVPMEVTRPEYPGAHAVATDLPVTDDLRALMRMALERDELVPFGPGYDHDVPAAVRERFQVQTQLAMALRPRLGSPWMFGIQQCSHDRIWTDPELVLFREIGRRLTEGVTSLLAFQDIRESEARLRLFRTLIDSTPDGIQVVDLEGNVLDVNQQACAALGYSHEEYVGLHLSAIDPDWNEANWHAWVERMRNGYGARVFEGRHRRKDGSVFPVEVNCTFVHIDRDYVVGIVRDITERKGEETARERLEEQLRQSQKMEAIGQLAGGVAHDFNNLLLVINFTSELIAERLDSDDPNAQAIAEIRRAGERAASLTRQLLAFSRKQVLHPEVVDANVLLAELLTMLERLIGEDIEIRLVAAGDLALTEIDRAQFAQAIVNLGVNARDAMPDGGVLTIETANADDHVVVTVSDTGQGMDEETAGRIFEPFFTTKEPGRGTGLGLAMVYGFVNQSGGRIEVTSRLGEGTTFSIHLPRSTAAAPSGEPAAASWQDARGTETVLVVEDADAVRLLVHDTLEACGYTVLAARDGADALDVAGAHEGPIDLLITDVVLPGLSGPQLAERLAAERPRIRCLLMSGYAGESLLRYGGSAAAAPAILQKPFDPPTLVRRVRDALDADPQPEA